MTSRFSHVLVLCVFALTFGASSALAGPTYHGGTISWSPTGASAGEVEFRVSIAAKLDGQHVGDVYSTVVSFGDTDSATASGRITSVNTAEAWFIASLTVKHTYLTAGPFTASVDLCCRLNSLGNGATGSLHLETLVRPLSGNSSPVSGLPAIVTVPLSSAARFPVAAADINRDTLRFRLAYESESGLPPLTGISVNGTTGQITWDAVSAGASVTGLDPLNLWTTQIVVEDRDSDGSVKSRIPVDVILKVVAATGAAPGIAVAPVAASYQVAPGSPLTFDITASDAEVLSDVTLNSSALPTGATLATLTPALDATLAAPVTATFAWTPSASQTGAYVFTFAVTDDDLQQTLKSIVVYVADNLPPVFGSCTAAVNVPAQSALGAQVALQNTVSDADADAIQVTWTVDGTAAGTESLAAGSTAAQAIEFVHTYAVGTHSVVLSATGGPGGTTTCTTTISVSPAAQTVAFANPGPFTYGAAPVPLTATATSGLPVAFTRVSGPGSITNGVLTITGAGDIVVRATQPGDSSWLAATPVEQTIVVAKAPLTVTATDATKAYGAPLPAFGVTYQGFVLAEGVSALGGTLAFSTAATQASPAGNYSIAPSGLTSSNYLITFQPGAFVVTKAPLTVTARNATIAVGEPLPVFSAAISGYVLGETSSALGGTLTFGVPAGAASTAGEYAIAPSGLTAANYAITYVNGQLSVTAPLCGFEVPGQVNGDRTIPVSLGLCGASGETVVSASVGLTAYELIGPNGASLVPQDSGNSNPGGEFRLTGNHYTYNLKTTGLTSGIYRLKIHVTGDTRPYAVSFPVD